MKQYLQFLQRISTLLSHITNNFLIIVLIFFYLISCDNTKKIDTEVNVNYNIDSIFIFTTSFDIYTAINISKAEFYSFYKNCPTHNSKVIVNKNEIDSIMDIIYSLKGYNDSNLLLSDFEYKPVVVNSGPNCGYIYLVNNSILDVRALIIIAQNNIYKPIWLSNTLVENDKRYYRNNDTLRKIIEKYEQ